MANYKVPLNLRKRLSELPEIIAIHEFLFPKLGEAYLEFVDMNAGVRVRWRFSVAHKLSRALWRKAGRSPVVWHVVPATEEHPPIIHIIADRNVKILETVTDADGSQTVRLARFDQEKFTHYYPISGPKPTVFIGTSKLPIIVQQRKEKMEKQVLWEASNKRRDHPALRPIKPLVLIYRVQHPAQMPGFDDIAHFHNSLDRGLLFDPGARNKAVMISASNLTMAKHKAKEMRKQKEITRLAYIVWPHPRGVAILHVGNRYEVHIDIEDPYEPAAYAFTFYVKGSLHILLVHHTDSVNVRVRANHKEFFPFLKVDDSRNIPPQGSKLVYRKKKDCGKLFLPKNPTLEKIEFAFRLAFEIGIGLIPVVGVLYDIGQLVYIYHTGKDFFGEEVPPEELAFYGLMGGLGIAVDSAKSLRKVDLDLQRFFDDDINDALKSAFNQLSREYNTVVAASKTVAAVETDGSHVFLKQLAVLPPKAQKAIIKAIKSYATDHPKLLKRVSSILAKNAPDADTEIGRLMQRQQLDELLTSNGKSFRQFFLHHEYQQYIQNPKRKNPLPLEWAKQTRNPWAQAYLKTVLGKKYVETINNVTKTGIAVTAATLADAIPWYDTIIEEGLEHYSKLNSIRERIPNGVRQVFREAFQFEHPVEQRFYTSLGLAPYGDEFSSKYDLMTILVPRTRHTAQVMFEEFSEKGRKILYTQDSKTTRIRKKIPFGAEHLFTVQEIADVTIYSLRHLEADEIFDLNQLLGDFIPLARYRDENVPVLAQSLKDLPEELFDTTKGWPHVVKENGVWKIKNLDVVNDARVTREKWARAEEIQQVKIGKRKKDVGIPLESE